MTVSNVIYHDIPFEEYLKLPGYSYSGLKARSAGSKPFIETPKMRLGTAVHQYLLTPAEVRHVDPKVRLCALKLKNALGALIKHLKPELAITADFENEGFVMKYKGRLDLCVPGKLVVDIKVTELPLEKAIDFFRYDRQQSGYALAASCPLAFIISIHPTKHNIDLERVPIDRGYWKEKILEYGTPILKVA